MRMRIFPIKMTTMTITSVDTVVRWMKSRKKMMKSTTKPMKMKKKWEKLRFKTKNTIKSKHRHRRSMKKRKKQPFATSSNTWLLTQLAMSKTSPKSQPSHS